MSLEDTEKRAAEHAVAPRVSLQDLEAKVLDKHFVTAKDAIGGAAVSDEVAQALSLTTLCILVTKSGFTLVGKSACVSPENFNKELGEKVAYDNALAELWGHEGYMLRDKLAGA